MNEEIKLTESEAIEAIKNNKPTSGYVVLNEALDMAIKALEEVQQYREDEKELLRDYRQACKEAEANARMYKDYLEAGTVEECIEAVAKQKPEEPIREEYCGFVSYKCPTCHHEVTNVQKYCDKCGQKLGE